MVTWAPALLQYGARRTHLLTVSLGIASMSPLPDSSGDLDPSRTTLRGEEDSPMRLWRKLLTLSFRHDSCRYSFMVVFQAGVSYCPLWCPRQESNLYLKLRRLALPARLTRLVISRGFEPLTFSSGGRRSNPLSYETVRRVGRVPTRLLRPKRRRATRA